jgi:hypothetical protein
MDGNEMKATRQSLQTILDSDGAYLVAVFSPEVGLSLPVRDVVIYDDGFWVMLDGDTDGRGIHSVRGKVEWGNSELHVEAESGSFDLFPLTYGLLGDLQEANRVRKAWAEMDLKSTTEQKKWREMQKNLALLSLQRSRG